jgi:hypothetical protein
MIEMPPRYVLHAKVQDIDDPSLTLKRFRTSIIRFLITVYFPKPRIAWGVIAFKTWV